MRYLSVCSGIEAASVAWHPLGWTPAGFSEIEAFPRAVLKHRFPDVPLHGNFTRLTEADVGPIDLLVGGTPCQSFSVAGKRAGLDDPRGNLALEFLRLARRLRPRWLVWENVPGVLSLDEGRAFGTILGLLGELGYGWAYRKLDAQYVRVDGFCGAVPQRRQRVFVVGYLGDWRPSAAVLLEPESLRGDSPPRRKAGERVADHLTVGANQYSGFCGEPVAHALNAHGGPHGRIDAESETFVAHSLTGEGFDASEDGTGRGTPLVAQTVTADMYVSGGATAGNNPGVRNVYPVAFSCKDSGADAGDTAPTLRAMGHDASHANAGGQVAVAFTERTRADGRNLEVQEEVAYALTNPGSGGRTHSRQLLDPQMAVRRLTPREGERLQGFPDDWTLVPYRKGMAKDGPRYKALGNAMAVNVMRWIGIRIDMAEAAIAERDKTEAA